MRWTAIIEDHEDGQGVKVRFDPPISKADLANHIAQLKVNGRGYGAAFDYICSVRNFLVERSRGVMKRDKYKDKDGRLIITLDS
jgi:hypothetical protein